MVSPANFSGRLKKGQWPSTVNMLGKALHAQLLVAMWSFLSTARSTPSIARSVWVEVKAQAGLRPARALLVP
jgi:hypothetical protein